MKKGKMSIALLGIAVTSLLLVKIVMGIFILQGEVSVPRPGPRLAMAEKEAPSQQDQANEEAATKPPSVRFREKEEALGKRESRVKEQEDALSSLRKEIDDKMAELTELQTTLTAYAKNLADREKALQDARNDHLVAAFTAMEPDRAAAIMSKLELSTIVLIMGNMKGKSAGKILAAMDPEKGAVVSTQLSQRK
jgi:flagellar motility protein MotE (MotC chaperone)